MNIWSSIWVGFEALLRGASSFVTWFTTPTMKVPAFLNGFDITSSANQFTPAVVFQIARDYINGDTINIAPIWVITTGLFAVLVLFMAIRLVITILDAIPVV